MQINPINITIDDLHNHKNKGAGVCQLVRSNLDLAEFLSSSSTAWLHPGKRILDSYMSSWGYVFGDGSQTMFLMPCSFIGLWGSLLFIWSLSKIHHAWSPPESPTVLLRKAMMPLRCAVCAWVVAQLQLDHTPKPQFDRSIENCWHGTSKHTIFTYEPPPGMCKLNPLIWVYVSKWCPFWVPKCPFISKKKGHHFETYTHKRLQWRYGHDRCLKASQVSMIWTSWTSDATTSVEMDGASFPQPCVGAGLSSPCKPRNKPYA